MKKRRAIARIWAIWHARPRYFAPDGGQPIGNLAESGSSPIFSPDGHWLAYADGDGVKTLKMIAPDPDYRPVGGAATLAQELRPIVGIT